MTLRCRRLRTISVIAACLAALVAWAPSAGAGSAEVPIAIIVSTEWESLDQVDLRVLQRIYLRNLKKLKGMTLLPVDHLPSSRIYEAFRSQVVRRKRKALEDYWLEQALTGGPHPPRQFEEAGAVIDFVARHVGAIAYVGLDTLESSGSSGVKAVALTQRGGVLRPSQSGYALTYTKP